jgi:hypothetical protein
VDKKESDRYLEFLSLLGRTDDTLNKRLADQVLDGLSLLGIGDTDRGKLSVKSQVEDHAADSYKNWFSKSRNRSIQRLEGK